MTPEASEPRLSAFRRRLLTLTTYPLVFALLLALAPILFVASLARDLVFGSRLATTRGLLFILCYFGAEIAGILGAGGIWTLWKLGGDPERKLDRYYRLQWWWSRTLFDALRRLFGLELCVRGIESVGTEHPVIVLMRHTSMADTLLPGVLLSAQLGMRLRYILKRELLWDPCLDLVGHQLPNVFVERGSDHSEREARRVGELAQSMSAGDGVLLYPEGTRFSPARRARILEQQERDDSPRAAVTRSLRYVLSPRRGGTQALLDAAPEADVVVCVHHGFEGVAGFRDLIDGALVGRRIEVEFLAVARTDVSEGPEGLGLWLDDVWADVDDWVAARTTRGSSNLG